MTVDTDSFDLSGPQLDDLIRRFAGLLSDVIRSEVDDPVLPTQCVSPFQRMARRVGLCFAAVFITHGIIRAVVFAIG